MRAVLSDIKSRLPSAPLALVGASLGANMVIKFLGEEGSGSQIWGAVAIGCPFDLLVCDRFMNRTHVQVEYLLNILTIFFAFHLFGNAALWGIFGRDVRFATKCSRGNCRCKCQQPFSD
jgi:predicted alpha/beta-fold hydrolase